MFNDEEMLDSEGSLEFLLEYLKAMIQEKEDTEITKVGDISEILSDFMNTFLIVIDTLLKTIQNRFNDYDNKLIEFENLLLHSSTIELNGLIGELDQLKKASYGETPQKLKTTARSKRFETTSPAPPPPPPAVTTQETSMTQKHQRHVDNNAIDFESIGDSVELEDIASAAFSQEKMSKKRTKLESNSTGGVSLRLSLMDELKKKFKAQNSQGNDKEDNLTEADDTI